MNRRGKGRGRGRGKDNQSQQNVPGACTSDNFSQPSSRPGKPYCSNGMSPECLNITSLNISTSISAGSGKEDNACKYETADKPHVEHLQLNVHHDHTSDQVLNKSCTETSSECQNMKGNSSFKNGACELDTLVPSKHSTLARRPNFGTAGRVIKLISNFFKLQSKTSAVYHYDIEMNSLDQIKKYGSKLKAKRQTAAEAASSGFSRMEHEQIKNVGKIRCKEIFSQLVKSKDFKNCNPIYDGGKNMYTVSPLPFQTKQNFIIELPVGGKVRKYEVVIQPVRKEDGSNAIDVKELIKKMYKGKSEVASEIVLAFNTIMNYREPHSSQIQVGRSFFFLNQKDKIALGEGIEIWFGYNQSVHFTQTGPAVVLNLAAKAFHKSGPVIDYIGELLRRDITRGPLKHYEIKKIENSLKGVRVSVTHLPYARKYHIQGVSKLSAHDLKLNVDGREMSIAQYFQTKYGGLRFPHLHCLYMRSNNNQTYIPFEKCIVCDGQPKLGKLNAALTAKMIKQTAIPPAQRFKAIQNDAMNVQKQSGEQMNNFNLFMDLRPILTQGRVIDPPSLAYLNTSTHPDNRGVWRMDGKKFKSSVEIDSWILLSFADERDCSYKCLENFADIFTKSGNKVGLCLGRLLDIRIFDKRDNTEKALETAEKTKAAFAVIVLSRRDCYHNYEEIKFIADYKLGFVTQCMDENVVFKINDQIATNVCLKINAKLGGINHTLVKRPEVFSKPVIVFGADAVHSPRGSGCPSIASVVGSLDAYPSRYKLACRVQENPDGNKISQELILELKDMVKSILKSFYHHTKGKYPEKIIFFRDGVSEGQFETVRDYEVREVQKASQDVIGYYVPITFITVQKRHQMRFKVENVSDGVGRGNNPPPGTAIDRDVTHPVYFDYYLYSHEGIQGTSKPAHYTVLYDENNFSADEIQKLSYHLCYTYVRCNRSVSIPAPVMYADLAAYRAKKYADFHIMKERDSCSSSSSSSCKLPDYARNAINSMGNYKTNMFYL